MFLLLVVYNICLCYFQFVLAVALAAVMAEEGARDKKQAYVATFPGKSTLNPQQLTEH